MKFYKKYRNKLLLSLLKFQVGIFMDLIQSFFNILNRQFMMLIEFSSLRQDIQETHDLLPVFFSQINSNLIRYSCKVSVRQNVFFRKFQLKQRLRYFKFTFDI